MSSEEARPRIGTLALQGDFAAHARALDEAGANHCEVRRPDELEGLDGLVIPGGESTTMLRLLEDQGMDTAIQDFHRHGGALLGTCAGLILLAKRVEGPTQPSLGLLDVSVVRNAYGRQVESFVERGRFIAGEEKQDLDMVFIRAPRIQDLGPGVEILATLRDEPVLVRQGRVLGAAFHPELIPGGPVHRLFARIATGRDPDAISVPKRPAGVAG